jgi:hypothetical protein
MRIAARDSVISRSWNAINQELINHYLELINDKAVAQRNREGVVA